MTEEFARIKPDRAIPLYQALARALTWQRETNENFRDEADSRVKKLIDRLPHGSGIDGKTTALLTHTTGSLWINVAYHHMNEGGFYDGWTEHIIRLKPDLCYGFSLAVGGEDRNQIKDYLAELFDAALRELVPEYG